MKNPIKTFEANTEGRDFAIGDLHGSFSAFMNLLVNINFDPEKDRMFSVGDLVDRGPESLKCLELLYEPWFHAVLSNHEQMMWEAFHGGYMGMFWQRNGGMWGAEALNVWRSIGSSTTAELSKLTPTEDQLRLFDLIDKVGELPFIMTVGKKDGGKIHIIHAELPPGSVVTDEVLADPEKVIELAKVQSSDGDFMVWGRHLYYNFCDAPLENLDKARRTVRYFNHDKFFNDKLSHVISGHTIVRKPLTILGQTNIDTCVYGSYREDTRGWEALTCVDINEWKFYQATEKEFRTVEPVVILAEDLDK